ncbi:MAG: (Fe-S)-binding protein [Desulfobacterales bacterium]|nr:(Fe-S)-binding protein [Desulfobacterales bacterium]
MSLVQDFYKKTLSSVLNACTACGACVAGCPIVPHTTLANRPPNEVAQQLLEFLEFGQEKNSAKERALSCMECFKCTTLCPQGLSPLHLVELVKTKLKQSVPFPDAAQSTQDNRLLCGALTTLEEFHRLTTSSPIQKRKTLFFPGCNVYCQPEKLLNALDLLHRVDPQAAFLPGLSHCCGDTDLFLGDIDKASQKAEALMKAIAQYEPETLVLWCPTCQCRFESTLKDLFSPSFDIVSLPAFLYAHIEKLPLQAIGPKKLTLHDPCKSAYLSLETQATRDLLQAIPGASLVEMPRHGKKTACCGSGATVFCKEGFQKVRDERMREAKETQAHTLVDVCHFCHQCFGPEIHRFGLEAESYINLLAQASGIYRQDRFMACAAQSRLSDILYEIKSQKRTPCVERLSDAELTELIKAFFPMAASKKEKKPYKG